MKLPFVRNPFNYDRQAACEECCVQEWAPSMTQQSQALDADINEIMRRFGITGQMPETYRQPQYGDFPENFDFHKAQNIIREAGENFMRIPPQIRDRFHNDPAEFHDFCTNPDNLDELRKLGLAKQATPPPQNGAAGPAGPSPAKPGEPAGNRQEEPRPAPNPVT